jgi:hypothetical protein
LSPGPGRHIPIPEWDLLNFADPRLQKGWAVRLGLPRAEAIASASLIERLVWCFG